MRSRRFVITTRKTVRARGEIGDVGLKNVSWYQELACSTGEFVDKESADETTDDTDDGGDRNCGCRLAEGYSSDENDCL